MEIVKPKEFEKTKVFEVGNWNIPLYSIIALFMFLVGNLCQSFLVLGYGVFYKLMNGSSVDDVVKLFQDPKAISDYLYSHTDALLIMFFGTIFGILIVLLFAKFIEKRKMSELGLKKEKMFKHYGLGILFGFATFSFIILIEVLTGALKINGFNALGISALVLIPFAIGFMIQSFEEELLFRGYLLPSIAAKNCAISSILISALAFGIVHSFNTSFSLLACLNITLIGIVFGLVYVITKNVWVVSGFHFIWNYVQGCLYGVHVSGINVKESILNSTVVEGKDILSGGGFGTEGSIITTIVIFIIIVILLVYMYKNKMLAICNCKK